MSRRHLLPPENEDYLERLGLNEDDRSVYMATLDAGLVSVGEIVQLTEFELSQVLESVRDLVDIGLIKKAQGRMPRYYAILPFFRETLSVEKEALFSLNSMIQSLKQSKETISSQKDIIVTRDIPDAMQKYLDDIYKKLIGPIINDLEIIKTEVENLSPDFLKSIENENEALLEELALILGPLKEYGELLNQKFDITVIKEGSAIDEYIIARKSERMKLLKLAHEAIGRELENIKNTNKVFRNDIKNEVSTFEPLLSMMDESNTSVQESFGVLESAFADLNIEKEGTLDDISELKKVVEAATLTPGIDKAALTDIENRIDAIAARVSILSLDSKDLIKRTTNSYYSLEDVKKKTEEATANFLKKASIVEAETISTVDTLAKNLGDALNSINTSDQESLIKFQRGLNKNIDQFGQDLKSEGKNVIELIDEHTHSIDQSVNNLIEHWKNRMLTLFNLPIDAAGPFLEKWIDRIKPAVDEFNENSSRIAADLFKPIEKLEQESFGTLIKRVQFVKAIVEARTNDLQNIWDIMKSFDYTKSSDTWVVIGIPALHASLSDMVLRTKSTVTIVSPRLNTQLLENVAKIRSTIRITIVADMDKTTDKRLLRKVREIGRIQLRKYPARDLYACIRDSEEIIFGYEKENEEIIGIRSSTPSIIQLLQDRLNETVIRNSKPFDY